MPRVPSIQQSRRRHFLIIGFLLLVSIIFALPLVGHALDDKASAKAESSEMLQVPNPAADLWRAVRQGKVANTQAKGTDSGVLISDDSAGWIERSVQIREYSAWGLVAVPLLLAIFFLLRGTIKVDAGMSYSTLPRWSLFERVLHWFVAVSFVLLLLTGFSLMYGRIVLIPLLGHAGFGAYAAVAKDIHNYVGPVFCVGVVLMLALWVHHNLPKWVDVVWFFKGGGMVGTSHPSAGRMNGGEKLWFWWIATVGLVVCATGLIMDFPAQILGELGTPDGLGVRETIQWSNTLHAVAAVAWSLFFFGHAYIGTIGTEGALQGMTTGRVDYHWALQHHDLWVEELKAKGVDPE